jgi:hypothetical protein
MRISTHMLLQFCPSSLFLSLSLSLFTYAFMLAHSPAGEIDQEYWGHTLVFCIVNREKKNHVLYRSRCHGLQALILNAVIRDGIFCPALFLEVRIRLRVPNRFLRPF